MLDDLVDFMRAGNGPPLLDPRVARVIEWLSRNPADLTPLEQLVRPDGLSVSRFLHLFSDEINVTLPALPYMEPVAGGKQHGTQGYQSDRRHHQRGF